MTRYLSVVLAFSISAVGCVTDDDEPVVVGHGTHHSYMSAEIPRNIDADLDSEETLLEDNPTMNSMEDSEEAVSEESPSESDVFVEDLNSQENAPRQAAPAPAPQAYTQGSNTAKSPALPRQLPATPKVEKTKAAKIFYVKTRTLNVRKAPNTRADIVKKLSRGQKITAVSRQGQWVKIGGGQYVLGTHLTAQAPAK